MDNIEKIGVYALKEVVSLILYIALFCPEVSENDPRVPLSEAEQLVDVLRKRDIAVEFLLFDDEGHGVAKLKNKLVAYTAVCEFLDQVLGT